jgi:hypothetical protein
MSRWEHRYLGSNGMCTLMRLKGSASSAVGRTIRRFGGLPRPSHSSFVVTDAQRGRQSRSAARDPGNVGLVISPKTLVTASLAVGLYVAAPHTFHANGIDATDDLNSQLSDSSKSLAPTPRYAPGVQFFDIKTTATTYAPTFKKYVYSFALPQPALGIVGFGGYVSITSGSPRFSEALISAHHSPSGHCPSDGTVYDTYDQIGHDFPDSQALGRFILKLPTGGTTQLPTQFALPAAIPVRGCIFVILDGGIGGAGGAFTMTSGISLAYTAGQPSSSVTILSLDDEFCLGQSWGCQLATTNVSERTAFAKVLKITRPSTLKALYGDISDSALGPAGYAAPPTGFPKRFLVRPD